MATMVTPKIPLLDEHTAALDPATAKSARPDQTDRCREKDHLPYGNPQYAPGIRTWKPYPDDGFRKYHLRCERRKTGMTVEDLLEQFAVCAGKRLDNDRILFSQAE